MSTGRFCWHDLMTLDSKAAQAFYGALLGWRFGDRDVGSDAPYVHIHDGLKGTGGVVQMNPDDQVPPHWMLYVTVDDCDAAVEQAISLGGQKLVGPIDIAGTGRFAVIADDQGAAISVIALQEEEPEPGPDHRPAPNQFCWYSIAAADPEKAKAFYGALFGWTCVEMSMGGETKNQVFQRNGIPVAGLNPLQGAPTSHWATAIAVDDLDAQHERAIGLGATGILAPMPLGTMGKMSVIADPTGAVVSLFQSLE